MTSRSLSNSCIELWAAGEYFHTLTHSVQVKICDPSSDSSSQWLLILMFTNMIIEYKKSAFQIRSKEHTVFTCGSITYSVSIHLMTYFRCGHLCHTRSICLLWLIIETCPPPLSLSLKLLYISPPMVFKISVCEWVKNQKSLLPLSKLEIKAIRHRWDSPKIKLGDVLR